MISVKNISVAITFLIVFILLFLAVHFYFYFKRLYQYWAEKNIPCAKPVFPLGNLTEMISKSAADVFKKLYDESKHQRYYGLWMLNKPVLLVNDPALIKRIFVENFADFQSNGKPLNNIDNPTVKENLFALEGSEWKDVRTKVSQILSPGKLKSIFPLIVKCSRDLQDVFKEPAKMNDPTDIKEFTDKFIMYTIASTAFGIETDDIKNPDNEIGKMMEKYLKAPLYKWKFFLAVFVPRLSRMLKVSLFCKEAEDFFLKYFRDLVNYRVKNNFSRKDLLQMLIELLDFKGSIDLRKGNTGTFTLVTLASQAMTFLSAGKDSCAAVLQFALYELAMNPDIQKKLRKEIIAVLTRHNGEITYNGVIEMEYLRRVVDETLRKYPPGGLTSRECTNEFKDPYSNLIIDKKTTVIIPIFGIHRDEQYYPDPEKFDPDRFLMESKSSRPNYTFLPFGEGPRNCFGQRFAIFAIYAGLVAILSKYNLEKTENLTPRSLELDPKSLFTSPKGKIMLKISFADQ